MLLCGRVVGCPSPANDSTLYVGRYGSKYICDTTVCGLRSEDNKL